MRVVLAGGGTAGHVFPGLAVAEELLGRGVPQSDIHFATSKAGIGKEAVQLAGYPHATLSGRGIQRSFKPKAVLQNFAASAKLSWGAVQAFRLLRRVRPSVVLCLGGYVSVSAGVAARLLRIPVVVAEQNAVPGWANKVVARCAKAAAVSFEGTDLPRSHFTGNPVRRQILQAAAGRECHKEKSEGTAAVFNVLVLGGSLGAGYINQAVREALPSWKGRSDISISHITGRREWDQFQMLADKAREENIAYAAMPFCDEIAALLAEADLVVGRSGAGIVAELAVMGKPSLLVPLPGAPGDHQTANAKALGSAAEVIPQSEFNGKRLAIEIDRLARDPELLETMAVAAAAHARPDASAAVADLMQKFAKD